MCDYLDNYNLDSVDDATLSDIIKSAKNFIKRAEKSLTKPAPAIPSGVVYTEDFLEHSLLKQLKHGLAKLSYLPTGIKQPGVCLFGGHRYVYSKATTELEPTPLDKVPSIDKTLEVVNNKLGQNYNSVLVNKYYNKNTALNWHKDDEPEIDQTHDIATLSVGAKRRFLIADNRDDGDSGNFSTVSLAQNSVLTMKAGFQSSHVHKVDSGRTTAERGIRYSITFRRLFPKIRKQQQEQQPLSYTPHNIAGFDDGSDGDDSITMENNTHRNKKINSHHNCVKSVVFGSSLTKGLKEELLSRPGKYVKVISHHGARVQNIIKRVEDIVKDDTICPDCVENIFFVCGGNDVENIRNEAGMDKLIREYNNLIFFVSDHFVNAMINVISLIPRRLKDDRHLNRILSFNESLISECIMYDNCKYIDIFPHYLKYKKRFYTSNNEIYLNEKLYGHDMLHFSEKGYSVLAKVIMGITYNPY